MKKRDLILDFTSLLDVILIILFVVLSTMGQASLNEREEVKSKLSEGETLRTELADSKKALHLAEAKNEEAASRIGELIAENTLLKGKTAYASADKAALYEALMKEADKITLICTPTINPNKEGGNEVEIKLFSGEAGKEQEAAASVIFDHDFELSKEERSLKNAKMQADIYRALETTVKTSSKKLLLVTIQYTYGDKNFSQSDLDIISGAIEDVERRLNKTCYIDKIKQ